MSVAVVAGGAGFIGSHLCDALLGEGKHVICIDNLATGRSRNIAHLHTHQRFSFVQHDIVDGLPELPHVHEVYHLASPASPPGYTLLPVETMRVNAEGTFHLLELARHAGASFLYASTSEAYGDPLEHPQREDYRGNVSSTGPRSMYDEAKRYGEALTMAYVRAHELDGRIVRIFNTYGPRSDPHDGRLVPNLVMQALRGWPLTIYGDGTQTRSLCYVADLVEGLRATMNAPAARGQVINLGNPEEHTILEFATIIQELTGTGGDLVYSEPAVGDDPQRRRPDITRASGLLGWYPKTELHPGLRTTIDSFRDELATTDQSASPAAARSTPGI